MKPPRSSRRSLSYADQRRSACSRALIVLVAALCALASACADPPPVGPLPLEGDQLARNYWSMPVAGQRDRVPASAKPQVHPLSAERCGRCHVEQYEQWKTTIHAEAMGPGIKARTYTHSPIGKTACYLCHAPLSEQLAWRDDRPFTRDPAVPDEQWNWFQKKRDAYVAKQVKLVENASHSEALEHEGLNCAGCHLRDGVTYAGPAKGKPVAALPDDEGFHRAGIVRTSYLASAEFCRDCHQFYEPKPAKGKAIQNTYHEWKEGVFGKSGVACQSCHMPGGAHLWRGIHQKDWVSSAIESRLEVRRRAGAQGRYVGALKIISRMVGHRFPTYVTPRVVVRIALVDESGGEIPGTGRDFYIARSVDLRKMREHYDTRIEPGATFTIGYDAEVPEGVTATAAVGRITVEPDYDYSKKYRAGLEKPDIDPAHRALLEAALAKAEASPFVAFEAKVPILEPVSRAE